MRLSGGAAGAGRDVYGERQHYPAPAAAVSVSRLSGIHGGPRLQECAQPDHVRQGDLSHAERVRTELREAPHKSGDADQSHAQGGKQRRLAAEV